MIIRLGGQQSVEPVINEIRRVCAVNPLGALVQIEPIEPESSDEQRDGFHVLLDKWMKMDRGISFTKEMLKTRIYIVHFGAAKLTGWSGQEELIPVRTTTRIWDYDKKRYQRKLLSVEQYSELIEFTYRVAAQDGTVLPALDPDYLKNRSKKEKAA